MRASLLSTGRELLLGEIADTNAAEIARALSGIGAEVVGAEQVGDGTAEIAAAFARALERAGEGGLVVATGGLGPTADDRTREGLAEATGRPLRFHEALWGEIAARWAERAGVAPGKIPATNRRQAYLPAGARSLANPHGTAPGVALEHEGRLVCLLPGVPVEMRAMLQESLLPAVRARLEAQGAGAVRVRRLHLAGVREAEVARRIDHLMAEGLPVEVGTRASPGSITVRAIARA
jgi:molybdenum cofactor synthesis domain-containing protein